MAQDRPGIVVALLVALLATCGPANAQVKPATAATGPATRCDGPEFRCALRATPAFAADGTLWLAWNSASHVYVAHSADDGGHFSRPVEVTRGATKLDHSVDTRPQLVVGPGGSVNVGYAVMTEGGFMHGDLLHAHSEDGGLTFDAPRQVNANPAGKRFLSLSTDPAGAVFAAWVDKRGLAAAQAAGQDYAGAAVMAAWSRDGGASFGEPVTVGEHTCECCRIAVGFAAAGQPVIAWRNLFGRARDHAIATFTAPTVVGPIHRVSDDDWEIDACPHHGPSLAVATDGSYHLAWFTASSLRKGLFYARSTDAGTTFSAPLPIGNPARQPARPQVLAQGGKLWVAWREYDGKATEVLVMESRNDGRDWLPPKVVGRTTGTADHPRLVGNGRGVFVSWLADTDGYRLLPVR